MWHKFPRYHPLGLVRSTYVFKIYMLYFLLKSLGSVGRQPSHCCLPCKVSHWIWPCIYHPNYNKVTSAYITSNSNSLADLYGNIQLDQWSVNYWIFDESVSWKGILGNSDLPGKIMFIGVSHPHLILLCSPQASRVPVLHLPGISLSSGTCVHTPDGLDSCNEY